MNIQILVIGGREKEREFSKIVMIVVWLITQCNRMLYEVKVHIAGRLFFFFLKTPIDQNENVLNWAKNWFTLKIIHLEYVKTHLYVISAHISETDYQLHIGSM